MTDREQFLVHALEAATSLAESLGADPRAVALLRRCAFDSHPVSVPPHDAAQHVVGVLYTSSRYVDEECGTSGAMPEAMLTEQQRDEQNCMNYVIDNLESCGPLTSGEILACARQDAAGEDPDLKFSQKAVMAALERAVRRGLVVCDEHEDARARQGGCPALYRVAS